MKTESQIEVTQAYDQGIRHGRIDRMLNRMLKEAWDAHASVWARHYWQGYVHGWTEGTGL